MTEVHEGVIRVIAEILDLEIEEIVIEASLALDLGAKPLDIIEIFDQLQTRFEVAVPDEEAELVTTVGDLVTAIERCRE